MTPADLAREMRRIRRHLGGVPIGERAYVYRLLRDAAASFRAYGCVEWVTDNLVGAALHAGHAEGSLNMRIALSRREVRHAG